MIDIDDDDPIEIDNARLVHLLDSITTSKDAEKAISRNHKMLVDAQAKVAKQLQDLVGRDVVIFYKGRAYVPSDDLERHGYEMLPVYDLDAAMMFNGGLDTHNDPERLS